MAGFVEAVHAFAGVHVDVPDGTIGLSPQLPSGWSHLTARKWYGTIPFDVCYRTVDGAPHLEVDFPWGQVPDARIEVSLILPPRTEPAHVEAGSDSVPHSPGWQVETLSRSNRRRVRIALPAAVHLSLSLSLRRASTGLR